MKHKLFLCILILVVVGLYCQNCVEFFTKEEREEIQTILTNQIKSINVGDSEIKFNEIEERLNKELIDSGKCVGPMGPKGDTGGQANVYQGLYTKDTNSDILKVNADPGTLSESNPSNIIIKLKPTKESPLNLESGDRWQRTNENTLVYGYNPNFVLCYGNENKKIGLCDSTNINTEEHNINFEFPSNTQQIKVSLDDNMCLDSEDNKIIANKCSEDSKTQKFFLH